MANKIDLSGQRKVTTEEGRDLANKFHCPFLETSAAHRSHVDEVFHTLGKPYILGKGQIILKGLFDVLEFSQKISKRIRHSSKNEFVCSFFGRIRRYQKSFRNYLTFK